MTPRATFIPRPNNTLTAPATCRCGAIILRGYDSHLIATRAAADPIRATPTEEAAAWLTLRLSTWQLRGRAGHYELTPRTFPGQARLDVRTTALEVPVVIEHRCGSPPLATGDPIPTQLPNPDNLPHQPPY